MRSDRTQAAVGVGTPRALVAARGDQASTPVAGPEADLKERFLRLVRGHAAGQRYEDIEREVHALLTQPAFIELCRAATFAATRDRPGLDQSRPDVSQEILVRFLAKFRAAFDTGGEGSGEPARRRTLLGYRLDRGQGGHGLEGWLYTILRHDCADVCRKLRRQSRARLPGLCLLSNVPETPGPWREPDEAEPQQALHAALETLEEGPRRVLSGLLAGKSGVEIARELGRSSSWVTHQKQRGIALLRERL